MFLKSIINCLIGKKLEVISLFGSSNSNDRGNSSPITEGGEYDVKIEDTGRDGDGIARIEGFVVFVSGAKVGEEVKIRVNSTRRNFAFAEVVE
jgi:predicted RNA-binding protein with TRAM domain